MPLAFLRDAHWLTRQRIRAYAAILIAAFAITLVWLMLGKGNLDPLGRPVGSDFVSFWSVSWALLHDDAKAIYSAEALASLEQRLMGTETPFYAWLYPPIALLIVYPLAFLPYLWALTVWLITGLIAYLAALWRIIPQGVTLSAGLAFPAVLLTVEHGQNAFITTSILAWTLLLLHERPVAAGMIIGVLAFKPQLAVLIPVALMAGGHWRAVTAAAAACLGLAALSVFLFGIDAWSSYFAITPLARDVLDLGLVPHFKMQTVYAAVRLLGGTAEAAYVVQALAALSAAGFVTWAWHRSTDHDMQNAALIAAVPLATPFLLDYDLMILVLPIAWMARAALRNGALPWERATLTAVCVIPLIARAVAQYTGILLTPFVVVALLVLITRRILVAQKPSSRRHIGPLLNASTTATTENA